MEVIHRNQHYHGQGKKSGTHTRAFDFEGGRLKEIGNRAEAGKESAGATSTPAH